MAEIITETILPGTYIEVRPEGLLTIGAIPTGNVGILGTAEMGGPEIVNLDNYEDGRSKFGGVGVWDKSSKENLSLVRAMKFLFDNGARTVLARRVYDSSSAKHATFQLTGENNTPLLSLKARTPGTWGNRLQVRVEEADAPDLVSNESLTPKNGSWAISANEVLIPPDPALPVGAVTLIEHGLTNRYQIKQSAPSTQVVQVNPANRSLTFLNPPSSIAEVYATYGVPKTGLRKITLRYENRQEVYIVPSIAYLAQMLRDPSDPSNLVEVVEVKAAGLPQATQQFVPFSGGDNGSVTLENFQEALDDFVSQDVQLLVVTGKSFAEIKSSVLGHVEKTENIGRERVAVLGADSNVLEKILENANDIADKRVVLTAPGLRQIDPATGQWIDLPPYYTAAAIAGKLSSLSPHVSPTNKTLAGIDALGAEYNYGQLKALVQNRVLALQKSRGIRIVKGITTHDEAFQQITLRRIVDYVKQGTRIGANQYIGKLNNNRIRENLRTTLDSFLADLITREFLTGFKLKVFADRPMEIRGEVLVVMDLNPTFSIDVIRVIMNLS